MDSNLLQLVRRFWALLLLGALVGGLVAYVAAQRMDPTYESSVQLLVGPINASFDNQRASGNLARTYADLVTSGPVLAAAAKDAGVEAPVADLRKDVNATSNDVTRILTIRARSGTAEAARAFASSLANELRDIGSESTAGLIDAFVASDAVSQLPAAQQNAVRAAATSVFGSVAPGRLRVVDPPEVPAGAASPKVGLITILGAIAGLVVAGVVVLLREATNDRVDSEQALGALNNVRFLGAVSPRAGRRGEALAGETGAREGVADTYRLVVAKIELANSDVGTLLAVGADDAVGAGETVAHLASVLSEFGPPVTLVDATSTGEITELLDLGGRRGYTDLFADADFSRNGIPLDDFVVHRSDALAIVPRGTQEGGQAFDAARARALLERLRENGSLVLLYCPAIDRSPATLAWAQLVDGAVIVVRRRKTTTAAVERTLATLSMTGVSVLGTILRV